jgi:hypothetical protein
MLEDRFHCGQGAILAVLHMAPVVSLLFLVFLLTHTLVQCSLRRPNPPDRYSEAIKHGSDLTESEYLDLIGTILNMGGYSYDCIRTAMLAMLTRPDYYTLVVTKRTDHFQQANKNVKAELQDFAEQRNMKFCPKCDKYRSIGRKIACQFYTIVKDIEGDSDQFIDFGLDDPEHPDSTAQTVRQGPREPGTAVGWVLSEAEIDALLGAALTAGPTVKSKGEKTSAVPALALVLDSHVKDQPADTGELLKRASKKKGKRLRSEPPEESKKKRPRHGGRTKTRRVKKTSAAPAVIGQAIELEPDALLTALDRNNVSNSDS